MDNSKLSSYESPALEARNVMLEQVIAGSEEGNVSGPIQEEDWLQDDNINTGDITFLE